MNKNIELIQGSISKWKNIVDGTGVDDGPNNCPLCQEYFDHALCAGCPIYEHTSRNCCATTPYEEWQNYMEEEMGIDEDWKVFDEESRYLAQKELNFLKEILELELEK